MAEYSTGELKGGLKVLSDGEPCEVIDNEFVKPGKGQAFNRIKLKNLLSGRVVDKTLKSGDTLQAADVKELEANYLYNDGKQWHFMDNLTYEQYAIEKSIIGETRNWLREQESCMITLYDGRVIAVVPPNFVELKITDAEAGVKGDTATGGSKTATVETGATIKVPLFVRQGDVVKIDTRIGEYVGRAK